MIGMIMIPTTTPATKLDCANVASGRVSWRNGKTEKWPVRNFATGTSWCCSAKNPHIPNSRLGSAASRSMIDVSGLAQPGRCVLVDEQRHAERERDADRSSRSH